MPRDPKYFLVSAWFCICFFFLITNVLLLKPIIYSINYKLVWHVDGGFSISFFFFFTTINSVERCACRNKVLGAFTNTFKYQNTAISLFRSVSLTLRVVLMSFQQMYVHRIGQQTQCSTQEVLRRNDTIEYRVTFQTTTCVSPTIIDVFDK